MNKKPAKPQPKNQQKSRLTTIFGPQLTTLLSLLIICGMFTMVTFYHGDGGIKDWLTQKNTPAKATVSDVTTSGKPNIGGPFSLIDMNGNPITETFLTGQYTLLFFGFTYCPDICPTELAKLATVYDALSPDQQTQTQILFVSVDPKRDTPEQLKSYVKAFHPDFLAATGSKEELDAMTKAFLAYYAIRPAENPKDPMAYGVDHSGYTYLMSPMGTYLTHFKTHDSAESMTTSLQQFLHK